MLHRLKGGDASFYTCGCSVQCVSAGLKVNLTLQAASGNYIYYLSFNRYHNRNKIMF